MANSARKEQGRFSSSLHRILPYLYFICATKGSILLQHCFFTVMTLSWFSLDRAAAGNQLPCVYVVSVDIFNDVEQTDAAKSQSKTSQRSLHLIKKYNVLLYSQMLIKTSLLLLVFRAKGN